MYFGILKKSIFGIQKLMGVAQEGMEVQEEAAHKE